MQSTRFELSETVLWSFVKFPVIREKISPHTCHAIKMYDTLQSYQLSYYLCSNIIIMQSLWVQINSTLTFLIIQYPQ